MERVFNFAAGPAVMPPEVLAQARDEMLDWRGSGLSVMEMPFTGPEFTEIIATATQDLGDLLAIPPGHHVLFLQGGAYGHFAFLAMNLLGGKNTADYVETGHWSRRAIGEARRYCQVNIAATGEADGFIAVPPRLDWRLNADAAYCHITTNETADGVQFHWMPDTGAVPLVADMTSDFLSRPIDVARFGLIYASAQKNVGPAGLTILIVRDSLLGDALPVTPRVFDYTAQAKGGSMINTPPTYGVYMAGLVFQWLKRQGGLPAMERTNRKKSAKLYAAIDDSGFYSCSVEPEARSWTSPCFGLPDETLEQRFLARAGKRGLVNLKGHPRRRGIRASLYNAMPEAGVDALIEFMEEFARRRA